MGWDYRKGKPALKPRAAIAGASDRFQLIVALHTQCPCSVATVENLTRITLEQRKRVRITLLLTGPNPMHSPIVAKAKALPEACVEMVSEGEILTKFGARTSGQALLFDPSGNLIFSGGLTDLRGVPGDSAGIKAIEDAIDGRPAIHCAPVYGCCLQTPKVSQ